MDPHGMQQKRAVLASMRPQLGAEVHRLREAGQDLPTVPLLSPVQAEERYRDALPACLCDIFARLGARNVQVSVGKGESAELIRDDDPSSVEGSAA